MRVLGFVPLIVCKKHFQDPFLHCIAESLRRNALSERMRNEKSRLMLGVIFPGLFDFID